MHILFKEYFLGIMNTCFIFKLLLLIIINIISFAGNEFIVNFERFVLGVHYLVYLSALLILSIIE